VRRCDGLVDEAGRGEVGVLHLKPSRDQVAVDLLERQALSSASLCKGRHTGQTVEAVLPRRRANKSQPGRATALFPLAASYRCCGRREGPQGVSGAQCGLRHDRVGRCRKVKSEVTKGSERVVGKAAGDECVFIPGEGPRAGR
jgi:hypothetical protein